MDDPRSLAPIKGKMLNHISELSADALIQDGGFKKLVSTGDAVQLDRKYCDQETYIPYAKHVIVGNVIPRVNDLTEATHNRLLLISFNWAIAKDKQDVNLLEKLKAEMPGILAWAVEGARRLWENKGRFTEIPESAEIIEPHRLSQNPVYDFLVESAEPTEGAHQVTLTQLRQRFNEWFGKKLITSRIKQLLKGAKLEVTNENGTEMLLGWTWR